MKQEPSIPWSQRPQGQVCRVQSFRGVLCRSCTSAAQHGSPAIGEKALGDRDKEQGQAVAWIVDMTGFEGLILRRGRRRSVGLTVEVSMVDIDHGLRENIKQASCPSSNDINHSSIIQGLLTIKTNIFTYNHIHQPTKALKLSKSQPHQLISPCTPRPSPSPPSPSSPSPPPPPSPPPSPPAATPAPSPATKATRNPSPTA